MNIKFVGMTTALAAGLVFGCKSNMTALNSEVPVNAKGSLTGDFVLEGVKVTANDLDVESVTKAISAAGKDVFKGSSTNKQSLPVIITVESDKTNANGGIASVNNLFALCTLTIWPCVNAEEFSYTVKARSVVGEHSVSFKVLDRSWYGLSPFAIIPVPGWADERGEDANIKQYHVEQIAAASKAALSELPADYQTFLKNQPKYLEQIDQERSEDAYVAFAATKKAESLDGMTNETVKKNHQNDLVAAFKNSKDAGVKSAVLKKLNDDSFRKLPYDDTLIGYWQKIEDKRILALIYRNGFSALSDADRNALAGKIEDEKILAEMVTAPSRDVQREAQNRKEKQKYELKEQIAEAKRNAEEHARYSKRAKDNWNTSEAKREKKESEKYSAQAVQLQSQLDALNGNNSEGLYVKDENARAILYSKISSEVLIKIANDKVASQTFQNWNSGDCEDLLAAASMCEYIKDETALGSVSVSILNKVESFRSKCSSGWGYSWSAKDREMAESIVSKASSHLTDDMMERIVEKDRSSWSALADRFKDKMRASKLAVKCINEARATKKENEIKSAFKKYSRAIVDEKELIKLSVDELVIRRAAFDMIRDATNKESALAAIKAKLNKDLEVAAVKQGKLSQFIAEVGNGEDLITWLKGKSGQTEIQNKETFAKMKGKMIILKGQVKNIGQTMFSNKTYVSLRVDKVGMFNNIDIQFNVPDSLKGTVAQWMKDEVHIMRGKLKGTGDLEDDASCEDGEIIAQEKYDEVVGLKGEMDCIKWQIKQIDENHAPAESVNPSKFGAAVKAAAGWIKSGVDDIKSSGDDLKQAAEMLNGLFN